MAASWSPRLCPPGFSWRVRSPTPRPGWQPPGGGGRPTEWLPALKKAGYEKQFVPHSLRHFAATELDEQGMVGKLRSETIGHANEDVTNSIYTHVRRARVAAAADVFDPLRWMVGRWGVTVCCGNPVGAPRFELGTSSPPD